MKPYSLIKTISIALVWVLGTGIINYAIAQDSNTATSQKDVSNGKITGVVVDSETGETIIGVNVIIEGTTTGTATNIDGQYTINVAPGTYNLVISYVSYAKKKITGVEVESGEVKKLDITLEPKTIVGDEVTVTARATENTEAALLSSRKKSISFSNAISAEAISSSGAGDAAEAMKKVVGASVVDGKYVYVRGLGDRYSGTQLNGANLPSADPNKQSFQMDLFPSSLIKNITTIKTFTPDRPGNFTGGLVDVKTKDFPEQFTFEVSASSSYNSQSSFNEILLGNSSGTDFLGFDDGSRSMPDAIQKYTSDPNDNLEMPSRRSIYDPERNMAAARELAQLSNSFNSDMVPTSQDVGMNQSYSATIGDLLQLWGNDLGYTASITYGQSNSGYGNGRNARWVQTGSDPQSLNTQIDLQDQKGQRQVDIGGLLNLSYRFNPNHKISTTYLRSQSGSSVGRFLEGTYSYKLPSKETTFQSRTIHYTERSLSSIQMKGRHYLPGLLDATIDWNSSYSINTQNEPDFRLFQNQYRYYEGYGRLYSTPLNNVNTPPSRYFRNLDENNVNSSIDLSIPFATRKAQKGKVKFGGAYTYTDRTFRENRIEYDFPDPSYLDFDDVKGDAQAFFNNTGLIAAEGDTAFGFTIRDATSQRSNYDASKDLIALYGMVELPITDKLKFTGGYRMEDVSIETVSMAEDQPKGKLDNTDFLPSANLTYSINSDMNLRAAYTKTLARPTFRELAPYITFNFVGDYLFRGNAELERTLVTNYDLRWEWFTNPGEIIAISGFYKQFENPLERVIRIDLGNNVASIQNVDHGTVYGAEFEIRKRMDFVNFLRHFIVSTNVSIVESIVDIPRMELIETLGINTNLSREEQDAQIAEAPQHKKERDLVGQSPYTFNFDVTYQNPEIGLQAAVNYNLFGDRLMTVQRGKTPDSFERGYGTLNITASKSIMDHFSLNLSVSNLLDPEIKESQMYKGQEFINQAYQKGVTYSFGIKYAL